MENQQYHQYEEQQNSADVDKLSQMSWSTWNQTEEDISVISNNNTPENNTAMPRHHHQQSAGQKHREKLVTLELALGQCQQKLATFGTQKNAVDELQRNEVYWKLKQIDPILAMHMLMLVLAGIAILYLGYTLCSAKSQYNISILELETKLANVESKHRDALLELNRTLNVKVAKKLEEATNVNSILELINELKEKQEHTEQNMEALYKIVVELMPPPPLPIHSNCGGEEAHQQQQQTVQEERNSSLWERVTDFATFLWRNLADSFLNCWTISVEFLENCWTTTLAPYWTASANYLDSRGKNLAKRLAPYWTVFAESLTVSCFGTGRFVANHPIGSAALALLFLYAFAVLRRVCQFWQQKIILGGQEFTREEFLQINAAIGPVGKWYRCPGGHIYNVDACGRPCQQTRCPATGCDAMIGGRGHVLASGNEELFLLNLIDICRLLNPFASF